MNTKVSPLTQRFYVGQRVVTFDKDENCNVYGHVTRVFDESVYILWSDLSDDVRHDDPEDIATIKDSMQR